LKFLCAELREKAIKFLKSSIWSQTERKNIDEAVHAGFSTLDGVPVIAL